MAWLIPDIILEAARELRKNMTQSEKLLWEELKWRKLWWKFLRQKPIFLYEEQEWFPRYCIPDFCNLENKILIEVDGNIHEDLEIYNLDREKEIFLKNKNFIVIRIKNNEIFENIDRVVENIVASFP